MQKCIKETGLKIIDQKSIEIKRGKTTQQNIIPSSGRQNFVRVKFGFLELFKAIISKSNNFDFNPILKKQDKNEREPSKYLNSLKTILE